MSEENDVKRSNVIEMPNRKPKANPTREELELWRLEGLDEASYFQRPSWNVAPQTFQPVIRLNRDTGERELVLMRWGLVPYWAKDPSIGLRTINAKAETITTTPAFREANSWWLRRTAIESISDSTGNLEKIDAIHTRRKRALSRQQDGRSDEAIAV
jgi:SOS response associated peptidase (SRAP)